LAYVGRIHNLKDLKDSHYPLLMYLLIRGLKRILKPHLERFYNDCKVTAGRGLLCEITGLTRS